MIDNSKEKATENENDLTLVGSWKETLKKTEVGEMLINLAEFGLDSILQDGIIKDIPFLQTIVSIYRIGHTLRERSFLKKLIMFLKEIEGGNVDGIKRQNYIDRITKSKRTIQHELEYVMTLLDRFISEQKAKFLARMFLAYIYEEIDWRLFCQLSELLDRLLPGDTECLDKHVLENKDRSDMESCTLQRLQGLGVVKQHSKDSVFDIKGRALSIDFDGTYELTALGMSLSGFVI